MLRICFILTIVAGLGAFAISQFKVSPHVQTLESENAQLNTQLTQSQNEERKAKNEARKFREEAESLAGQLSDTEDQLQAAQARAIEQTQRADNLDRELQTLRVAKANSDRELDRYRNTGVTIEEILALDTRLKETVMERDAFVQENRILARTVNQLEAELDALVGPGSIEIALPPGLKGNILAVDPTWDFVVLDIGSDDGVLEHGKLMVSREGSLVAKIQVMTVMQNRSIANIIPQWKQADVQAGDLVVY